MAPGVGVVDAIGKEIGDLVVAGHLGALVPSQRERIDEDRSERVGEARLSRWLRQRRARGYADVAARAVAAARTQQTVLAGQRVTASIVAELADTTLVQHKRLKDLDQQIQDTGFRTLNRPGSDGGGGTP